jgi:DNA-binding GntR family transcriptional regulator
MRGCRVSRIVRSTLAEQAYVDLRERIMAGRLPPGQRLLPEELANTLAISPTPIKEALLRLATDGLVAAETRRGVVVRRITRTDIAELYEARLLVERHALQHGFAAATVGPALVRTLRAIQIRLIARRSLGTEEGLIAALALDRAFHARLVALAGNRIMAEWHARMLMQTHTLRGPSLDTYPLGRPRTEHDAIVEALDDGDAAAAGAALERHLTLSRDEMLSRMPGAAAKDLMP